MSRTVLTPPDGLSTDRKTSVLLEALPYICEYVDKTIVVKVGGSVGEEGTVLDDVVWLKRLGINGRKGLGFYTLRHTFRTVADEAKDQPAADFIMGHEVAHMSSVYREGIGDERLKAVTDYVGVGNLTKYKVRFAKQTWPGETFQTKIAVTAKRKENGSNLVDLECTLVNQDGEVKVSGEATAALPSRG